MWVDLWADNCICYDWCELLTCSESQTAATEDVHQSTVSLLADARRTAYIKGRWVFTDSGYEQQYRVVVPTLPGSGDYSLASMFHHFRFILNVQILVSV